MAPASVVEAQVSQKQSGHSIVTIATGSMFVITSKLAAVGAVGYGAVVATRAIMKHKKCKSSEKAAKKDGAFQCVCLHCCYAFLVFAS